MSKDKQYEETSDPLKIIRAKRNEYMALKVAFGGKGASHNLVGIAIRFWLKEFRPDLLKTFGIPEEDQEEWF